ncbi:MAG: ribosome-associated protein [Pseudomonadota bacterium]|nr:ribosome-associated protein [Pseudomonadota bacterium]
MNTQEITKIAINALEDLKGDDIVVIDTSKASALFNAIIVCSGSSTRQVSALAHNVTEDFKTNGIRIIGIEGKKGGEWVLVDGGDVVVHIMLPRVRSYYSLEELWNNDHTKQE